MRAIASSRLSIMVLCASAAAATSLGGLGVSKSCAGVNIDVRALTRNGVPVADPKSIPDVAVGDTIVFRVFAQVTGQNDAKPDCLWGISGSFLSTGGIKGNLFMTLTNVTNPFTATASSAGLITDLDGDGDLDIGSNQIEQPAHFFAVRSDSLTGPRSTTPDGTSVFPPGAEPTAIPHGTEYRLVTSMRMTITALGSPTLVNFRDRPFPNAALWYEDADEIAEDAGNGLTWYRYEGGIGHSDGLGVTESGVLLGVPEPASAGLVAMATGLGVVRRRRHRTRS